MFKECVKQETLARPLSKPRGGQHLSAPGKALGKQSEESLFQLCAGSYDCSCL